MNIDDSQLKIGKKIFSFFILVLSQFIFIAIIFIWILKISPDDLINDKISQNIKNIYFAFMYICLLVNLKLFSDQPYQRIFNLENKILNTLKGLLAGFSGISLYYIILTYLGYFDFVSDNLNLSLVFQIITISFFIAFLEEMIFRDFILRQLFKKYTIDHSLIIAAYIYAQLHFLRFNLHFYQIIIPLISLLMVGIILGKIYLSKNIFNSIGIHWGWIICISYINQSQILKINQGILLTGGLYPPSGLFGGLILFLVIFLMKKDLQTKSSKV